MRIEQYFLMTDYSLWEVILNGDSPVPTRVVEGVLRPVAPTTAEQKLARKNELKARGTLLMALPDKHQLKFNSHKDAKTLMEAIEKRFRGNIETKKVQKTLLKQQFENFTCSNSESLDQIHDKLQKLVSQLEIHRVSLSQEDVNLKFLRSLPSEWKNHTLIWRNKANLEEQSLDDLFNISAAASVSTVCAKLHVSSLPNVDSLSNAVIYSFFASKSTSPQLDNEDLKQNDKGRNLGANGPTSMGFDMSKVECYNCHWKGHFARKCRSPKDSRRTGAAEPHRRTVPVETSTKNALVSQCDENIKLLNIEVQLRDTALVTLRQKLEKAEQERDDLKLKFDKFQTSSKNLTELLASQTNEKTGLGYNSQVLTQAMFDCDNYFSSESDCESWPPSSLYDRFQPNGGYHVVPPSYTRTFMPLKLDLVFNTAPTIVETDHLAFNVQLSPTKPEQDMSQTTRPIAPIIEDWVSDFKDESETKAPQFVPSFVQSSEQVKSPRHYVQPIETSIPAATLAPASPKSTSSGKRRNRKACFVCKSVDYLIKDCDYHAKKMAQPTPRNYAIRGNHKQYASMTHKKPQKHMVPTTVLTQSKPVCNTAVRPVSADVPKIMMTRPRIAHPTVPKSKSPIRRHITCSQSPNTSNSPPRVTAVQAPMLSAAQGMQGKWAWRPKCPILDHDSQTTSASMTLKQFDYNDALRRSKSGVIDSGCSRHMKGNMSYLSDFEELNGGYVAFGGNPKGGKISGKGKIKTYSLGFFSWPTKDETSPILKTFITGLENQLSLKVKVIRSDNGTEFKNNDLNQFCGMKGIKREFIVPRTPKQNGIAERKNRTLIEAARTMLADSLLPIPFWAEAVNTACYVQNRILTRTMNYQPVNAGNQTNPSTGFQDKFDAEKAGEEVDQQDLTAEFEDCSDNSSNEVNAAGSIVHTGGQNSSNNTNPFSDVGPSNDDEPDHPDKVYKVVNALYGLHQAPRAWYETLATYLLENGFQKGIIDQTLFIKKQKGDILLVQIYVDDIIFGATNKDLCKSFEKLMKDKFQMSSMGELTFFLGLQVKQKKDGIFISQDKYIPEILRKFRLTEGKSASTPIDTEKPLLKDPDSEDVDVYTYRSMIGSLMYLTSSRPDIIFACKKQTVVATSSTKAEYVVAASCCAQVLWIQN
nr:putative ribonuclease H-like domain-containing protein [Tanacetum cinerariifolium]